jgi:hypothetical protein
MFPAVEVSAGGGTSARVLASSSSRRGPAAGTDAVGTGGHQCQDLSGNDPKILDSPGRDAFGSFELVDMVTYVSLKVSGLPRPRVVGRNGSRHRASGSQSRR